MTETLNLNSTISFGKWKGCTIKELIDKHRDYYDWLNPKVSEEVDKYYDETERFDFHSFSAEGRAQDDLDFASSNGIPEEF